MNGLNDINSTGLAPLRVHSAHAFGSANALAARGLPTWPAASIGLLLVLLVLFWRGGIMGGLDRAGHFATRLWRGRS